MSDDPSLAIQVALVARVAELTQEAVAGRVYDDVPAASERIADTGADFPYISIADGQLVPIDEECFDRSTTFINLNVWSRAIGYARQADILRQVSEAQDRADDAAREFYDNFKSNTLDAITGAKSLGDALANLAQQLGNMLLSSAFDSLFKPASGGSGGGTFGSLFSGLGNMFRATGGPVRKGQPYVVGENRAELFVPDQNGKIVPRVPSMPRLPDMSQMRASSGAMSTTFAPVIDARGADVEAVKRIDESLRRTQRDLKATILTTVREAPGKNVKLR
jgi:hypothetical protein